MPKQEKTITIFISYSWSNTNIADQIEGDLNQLQIDFIRDVRDLKYKASITDFMAQIRDADFAIILISDEYLKSKNCMTEALHLLKEREYEKKILPVIVGKPDIFKTQGRLSYTEYWANEKNTLERIIAKHSPTAVIKELSELKNTDNILSEINEFLNYISSIKNLSFDELKEEGYKSLLEEMGFEDVSYLVSLLIISFVRDVSKREILLDEWFEKHNPTTDSYSIRASIAKDRGDFERAEVNYIKALEMNKNNAFAINNYAFMLMRLNKDPDKAKNLLEQAISLMPNLTEARLNLGCLLTDKFGESEEAEKHYKEIISYNPTEERAYNNLANIYKRHHGKKDKIPEIVCDLYKKAIELNPNYIEARIGYSNYLSEFLGRFKEAEEQLEEIVKIDPKAQELIDVMKTRISDLIKKKINTNKIQRNEKCPCGSGLKFKKCHGK